MWFIILVVALTCLFVFSKSRLAYFASRGVRTMPTVPLFGNLTAVTFARENFVDAIASGYNTFRDQRYFGLYQYHIPTLIPRDPDLIRQIMVRDFSAFSDRGVHISPDCDPLFGRNLIMLQGSRWREMRSTLTPAFSAARSRIMAPLMAECANNVMEHLRTLIVIEAELNTDSVISPYVNDVISSCAFGHQLNTLKNPENYMFKIGKEAIIQHTTQVMKFFGYENFPALMKMLRVKIISSWAESHLSFWFKKTLSDRREGVIDPRPDFIQTLVEATKDKTRQDDNSNNNEEISNVKKFSDDDLVAQAVLFYVAGFDTTANLINFFLYEMAMNSEIQERLQEELDSGPDPNTVDDLYKMVQEFEYLDMIVSEVLRLWPLVGAADRRSVHQYDFGPTHEGSKHHLVAEPGIHIWLPIYSLHRDPKYWENPDVCDPNRFAPGNRANIKPYTYLPFGTGPRHCIGSRFAVLAAKVMIVKIFREFSVRPCKKTPSPQRLAPRGFILRPAKGYHLTMEPRIKLEVS